MAQEEKSLRFHHGTDEIIRGIMSLAVLAVGVALCLAPAAAQGVPTEAELDRKLQGPPPDSRNYQRRSARSFRGKTGDAASWVKHKLSGFHVTPARLCLALGLVGFLVSRNRNKKTHSGWLAVYVASLLMLLGGGAALLMKYLE